MSKIESLKSEIAEYESIIHSKGIPSDEKNAAMDEVRDLKKQISDLQAKEKAIEDMRAEKKKKIRKQVGGTKTKIVKKKAKSQIKVSKKAPKKRANMISVSANVKKFNKGRSKSDIIRDKQRKALSPGKRTSAAGNIYYEKRSNRGDVSRKERLEEGGFFKKFFKKKSKDDKPKEYKLFLTRPDGSTDTLLFNNIPAAERAKKDYETIKIKGEIIPVYADGGDMYKKGGSLYNSGGKTKPISKFGEIMREFKAGTLKSSSGETVTDKRQALAIAFAASRKEKMATA